MHARRRAERDRNNVNGVACEIDAEREEEKKGPSLLTMGRARTTVLVALGLFAGDGAALSVGSGHVGRRQLMAGAAAAVALPATADTVVPKNKVGVTPGERHAILSNSHSWTVRSSLRHANSRLFAPYFLPHRAHSGGVKYFTKVEDTTCSPFNPCSPQAGDIVKIKYKSFLSNGQMYDSSEGPGRKPLAAKYKADPPQLLPGWEEALDGMQMGQTRIIQVPAALAYGDKGVQIPTKDGGSEYLVPPNERLQFEITLVQVSLPPP